MQSVTDIHPLLQLRLEQFRLFLQSDLSFLLRVILCLNIVGLEILVNYLLLELSRQSESIIFILLFSRIFFEYATTINFFAISSCKNLDVFLETLFLRLRFASKTLFLLCVNLLLLRNSVSSINRLSFDIVFELVLFVLYRVEGFREDGAAALFREGEVFCCLLKILKRDAAQFSCTKKFVVEFPRLLGKDQSVVMFVEISHD